MQSKSISQTLLNNSQIGGVELKTLDTNLSDIGHGLYIESISKDRYADLRMCCDKPFWGHTHPLKTQYDFDNLNDIKSDHSFSVLDQRTKENLLKSFITVGLQELDFKLKNKKIHLILDENSSLSDKTLQLLREFSENNELIIEECDLVLNLVDNLFLTNTIDATKILTFSFFEYSLINSNDFIGAYKKELNFLLSAVRYIDFLLLHPEGKLKSDQLIIDDYIDHESLNIMRKNNYLVLKRNDLTALDFLKEGLLINSHNFIKDTIQLAFPVSCTKEELLDTLERVSRLLKR